MLQISNLSISVSQQPIIHNLSLTVHPSTTHAIMGPNGSGKSTLANTIAGHPHYAITQGVLLFNGVDITTLSPEKRAHMGIFLSFQNPVVIPGVRVLTFLHEAHAAVTGSRMALFDFQKLLTDYMGRLAMDPATMHRAVNEGFSGGEKKRFELLQMLVLRPQLVVLDEIDSGLDIDALRLVATALQYAREHNPAMSVIIITHYQRILQYIMPTAVHVMCRGVIAQTGDASLVHVLEQRGYDAYK